MKRVNLLAGILLVAGSGLLLNTGCGSNPSNFASVNLAQTGEVQSGLMPEDTLTVIELDRTYFTNEIQPMFEAQMINDTTKGCLLCHDKPFSHSYEESLAKVVPGHPEESELYLRATGGNATYKHRKIWASDSPEALKLIYWINGNK